MTNLSAESAYGPAPESDPVTKDMKLVRFVEGAVLRAYMPDTEAPQDAWDQYAAPVPAVEGPLVVNAPRAVEAVHGSPYVQPGTKFLPLA